MSGQAGDPRPPEELLGGLGATGALRRSLLRGLLSSALGLGVVVLALVLVARSATGRDALVELLARARWERVVAASTLMSVAFLFMGLRWRSLMPPEVRPPALGLTAMLLSGLLLNYALPGPVGELGAAWFAHRRYGLSFSDALASGVGARVIGLATASLLALIVWLCFDLPVPEGYDALVALSALGIGLGGAILAALAARPRLWQRVAARLLEGLARLPRLRGPASRAQVAVVSLTEAMAGVVSRGAGPVLRTAAWALAGHLAVSGGIGLAATSLGATPDPAGLLFTYTLTTAGAVLLFALPGSQLSWDAAFVTLLVGAAGLRLADGLAVATIVRMQQLALQGLGALSLTWLLATQGEPPPGEATPVAPPPKNSQKG